MNRAVPNEPDLLMGIECTNRIDLSHLTINTDTETVYL